LFFAVSIFLVREIMSDAVSFPEFIVGFQTIFFEGRAREETESFFILIRNSFVLSTPYILMVLYVLIRFVRSKPTSLTVDLRRIRVPRGEGEMS
jgi:hypothetical protein